MNNDAQLPEVLRGHENYAEIEDPSSDLNAGLTSLGFIRAAIRRSARVWCGLAVVGMLVGFGLYTKNPPIYQASTSLFLAPRPGEDPNLSISDDQAIVQSPAVARLAMRQLGLPQSVGSLSGFGSSYAVTILSDRVLLITVSAPSSGEAVSRASAIAKEFLRFRAAQMETEQNLVLNLLDQQISEAKKHIASITARISQISAQGASPARSANIRTLQTDRSQAIDSLTVLQQTTNSNKAATQVATDTALQDSQVLDAASPMPSHSRLKHQLLYAFAGLIAGLGLGLGIVVVRALISDRLYRRDDIAHALGAPVKFSVGTVRLRRWLPGRHGLAATRITNVRRIVAHLRDTMQPTSRSPASLAVVPVDDVRVPALCLVSLAISYAEQGLQVVVADLCAGSPAGRLLGVTETGVRVATMKGADLVVAIPASADAVPIGPLRPRPRRVDPHEAVTAACASADLLLTLATLDPSSGGEHLSTWATNAVVIVTAGQSSWTKIHAAGEMIRLAGTRLISAVLLGACKTDDSIGLTFMPEADRDSEIVNEGSHPDAEDFLINVDGSVAGPHGTATWAPARSAQPGGYRRHI